MVAACGRGCTAGLVVHDTHLINPDQGGNKTLMKVAVVASNRSSLIAKESRTLP